MRKSKLIHMILYEKVESYEKTLTFNNVIILIKSVFSKDKNNYYYNIFLEKCSYN